MSSRSARPLLSVTLLLLAGCANTVEDEPDVVTDEDVGLEEDVATKEDVTFPTFPDRTPVDTGVRDAGTPDRGAPLDVAVDARTDAVVDARADVPLDVAIDARPDVPMDVAVDARPDAPTDVPVDVRPDVVTADVVTADAVTADVVTADVLVADWSTRANDRQCTEPGVLGSRRAFRCPPGGTLATIWGTDEYTHDSPVCTAAVHAGRITVAGGGDITIEMHPGLDSYTASTRNGVTSSAYPSWPCSYAVIASACPTGRAECGGACVDLSGSTAHCGACGRACATGETCEAGTCAPPPTPWSTTAQGVHECSTAGVIGSRYVYRCAPGGTLGSVWGTDVYTHDSSICTAALHSARITQPAGGVVTIQMARGEDSYIGSTRNGVTSSSYGPWTCSFFFP